MVIMHDSRVDEYTQLRKLSISSVTTFEQALQDKYVDQEEIDNQFKVPKDGKISTEITFVGFGSVSSIQKQLRRLTNIDLSKRHIQLAGCLQDLKGSLERVSTLNLAHNLLPWTELISIIQILPNLRELILTNNRLDSIAALIQRSPRTQLPPLSSLTLGQINLDWTSLVEILSRIWKTVKQIDLWESGLREENMLHTCRDEEANLFVGHIQSMKLSHNCFPNLNWLVSTGPLKNLIELDVSNCHLKHIEINNSLIEQCQNLKILNISYNYLESWRSISCLNALPKLTSLICHENPVFRGEKYAKLFTIGRLSRLTKLNREEVTLSIRRDAEILYFKKTLPEYQAHLAGKHDQFNLDHPRYSELIQCYGIPDDLMAKQTRESKYITVDICYGEKMITKKLPRDMRVANVRMLCKKLFNLRPSTLIEITISDPRASESSLSYVLDKDGQTLDFFSVVDGHRLSIEELH